MIEERLDFYGRTELRKILNSLIVKNTTAIERESPTGKRKGLKYAALERLDALMADGQKRSDAKEVAREHGESLFAFTDGKIHAFESRNNYQKITMRFLNWVRDEHNIRDLARVDERADELVSLYLTEWIALNKSAWTLQTERSALRTFFGSRTLAEDVALPKRKRENITRSRLPAKRDKHFQPKNWPLLVNFVQACGLRREELRDLNVGDIYYKHDGQLVVHVRKGKGGREREVPAFPGREQSILDVKAIRPDEEKAFERLPSAMDIHDYRRRFAQEMYEYYSGRPLPPKEGRLESAEFDRAAAQKVTRLLGHTRIDIIFGHYIR